MGGVDERRAGFGLAAFCPASSPHPPRSLVARGAVLFAAGHRKQDAKHETVIDIYRYHRRDASHFNVQPIHLAGSNDEDLRIGCAKHQPKYAFKNGAIDEVALWNRALTEDEILTLSRGRVLAVSPSEKVSTTWGNIKRRTMHP